MTRLKHHEQAGTLPRMPRLDIIYCSINSSEKRPISAKFLFLDDQQRKSKTDQQSWRMSLVTLVGVMATHICNSSWMCSTVLLGRCPTHTLRISTNRIHFRRPCLPNGSSPRPCRDSGESQSHDSRDKFQVPLNKISRKKANLTWSILHDHECLTLP